MIPTDDVAGPAEPYVPTPAVTELAARLRAAAHDTVRTVLLYGSHLNKTSPDEHSAVDFVVLVDDYRAYYGALAESGELHRPVSLIVALANVLPPNVLAFTPDEGRAGLAKYLLLTLEDFERALGPEPPDHFVLGRMLQRVGVVWADDAEVAARVDEALRRARAGVLRWMLPYLDEPVDAETLGRRVLEVCYAGEFRPESTARAGRVFEAQAAHFREVLQPALERGAAEGTLQRRSDGRFEATHPPTRSERRRVRRYFVRSKARTTARWLKHTITFANWLPYIQRKVERHTGRTIRLTPLERAFPIVFLWPRVMYVLLTRPRRELRP